MESISSSKDLTCQILSQPPCRKSRHTTQALMLITLTEDLESEVSDQENRGCRIERGHSQSAMSGFQRHEGKRFLATASRAQC